MQFISPARLGRWYLMGVAKSFTVLVAFNKDLTSWWAQPFCCVLQCTRCWSSCTFTRISLTPHDLLRVAQAVNSGMNSAADKSLLLREQLKPCLGMIWIHSSYIYKRYTCEGVQIRKTSLFSILLMFWLRHENFNRWRYSRMIFKVLLFACVHLKNSQFWIRFFYKWKRETVYVKSWKTWVC